MNAFEIRFLDWFRPLREDIFKYADAMGVDPTPQQRQGLELVQRGERKCAIKSGQGTGKTAMSCLIGSWRALRHVDAMTYVTAPTMRQCKEVWLSEFRRILEGARYPVLRRIFDCTKSRVEIGGRPNWGIRFVTATKPENAQGIHEKHLTFLIDEGSGVERPFYEQIMGTLTNEDSLCVITGNPNTRDCAFFDCFTVLRHVWACLTFDSRESPLTSRDQIQYIADTYGIDSDVFRVRVLGEFPHMDANCIISSDQLEAAAKVALYLAIRVPRNVGGKIATAKQFGIDFARFGGDENVIVRRSGEAMVEMKFYPHTEPEDVVAKAFLMQQEAQWNDNDTWFCPDANGLGEGMISKFYRAGKKVHEFKAQRRARSREFANMISEAWFQFAKKVRSGKCRIINDQKLIKQLCTRQYKLNSAGEIQVEPKEKYVERDNESPDRADATVMGFYDDVEVPAYVTAPGWKKSVPGGKVWVR